jgi:flagellar M-ring protein FliF
MNDFATQLRQFWAELGVNQKVSLTLAAFGVLAGMGALLFWSSQPQHMMLYGSLDPKDMASVVEELQGRGIPYEIRQGNSIFVPREHVYSVRMELAGQGIPTGGGIGFEIFDRTNFGISDFVQRTNYLRAVQGELQRTISMVQGVREARVMIVIPQNRLLVTNEAQRPTASVFVDTGGRQLTTDSVNAIRFLVANSVEGLLPADVAVVDNNGRPLSQDLEEDEVIGAASGQFKFRRSLEDYFTKKVESMLARVVGAENVVARISVELDTEASTKVEEIFDPEGQVIRTQTTNDETSNSVERNTTGTVGVTANTPQDEGTVTGGGGPQSTSTENRKTRTTNFEINRTTTEVVSRPGSVKDITAAVFVAQRVEIADDGTVTPQPRTAAELQSLRQIVAHAIGVPATRMDAVITLVEQPFARTEETPKDDMAQVQQQVMHWAEVLRNFLAVGFAGAMFLFFLRLLKRHKPEPISLEVVEDMERKKKEAEAQPRLTPELLNELIREKPDNVATALRSWAIDTQAKN